MFTNRVSIKEHPKINEWLTLVEKEMRMTLATLLASAVSNIGPFKAGQIDQKEYMKWVDSYQVIISLTEILLCTFDFIVNSIFPLLS